jgi:dihydroorotate dehydrogenase electron transfer subunit
VSDKASGRFPVIGNVEVAPCVYRLDFDAPNVARSAKPGQFVMIRPAGAGTSPLLARPFSLYRLWPEEGRAAVLFRVVGEGTRELARLRPGEQLSVVGPLGRGFVFDQSLETAYLVAGGMGVAPIAALAEFLFRAGVPATIFYGLRSESEVVPEARDLLADCASELITACEEGFSGAGTKTAKMAACQGLVTDPLSVWLALEARPIFACGPRPMLKKVAELSQEFQAPAQVSLETHMACGFGVCLGCVTPLRDKNGAARWGRVCTEGPVFRGEEVAW